MLTTIKGADLTAHGTGYPDAFEYMKANFELNGASEDAQPKFARISGLFYQYIFDMLPFYFDLFNWYL